MAATPRLLIVEDNDALRETLSELLAGEGYHVAAFACAEDVSVSSPCDYDIAILDLNLPGEDGLSLANRLRQLLPHIGIVMLTVRGKLDEKVAGYESGADIYLLKPVAQDELVATLKALARRLGFTPDAEQSWLNRRAGRLETRNGAIVLREAECAVLHALAIAPSSRLEISQLLEAIGKPADEHGRQQLVVLVSRLRKKLESNGLPSPTIRAERGIGYRLAFDLRIR